MFYHGLKIGIPGINLQSAVVNGCKIDFAAPEDPLACKGLMHLIFSQYLPHAKIDGVIFTAIWQSMNPREIVALGQSLKSHGVELLVIGPAPGYTFPVGRVLAEAERRRDPDLKLIDANLWNTDRQLGEASKHGAFLYLSTL
jgi:hypothetical protein